MISFMFQQILTDHLARYPLMQVEDVYKLVHQASLGSEHAVSDVARAREWLAHELTHLGKGPAEPILDPISADGRILRVHLRPYIATGGDPARLLDAFVRTANGFQGSIDQLRIYWAHVEQMAVAGHLPFSQALVREYAVRMEELNYPVVHHSDAYRAAYRPAYRIIARDFLP
jgi:hypothetical protein